MGFMKDGSEVKKMKAKTLATEFWRQDFIITKREGWHKVYKDHLSK